MKNLPSLLSLILPSQISLMLLFIVYPGIGPAYPEYFVWINGAVLIAYSSLVVYRFRKANSKFYATLIFLFSVTIFLLNLWTTDYVASTTVVLGASVVVIHFKKNLLLLQDVISAAKRADVNLSQERQFLFFKRFIGKRRYWKKAIFSLF